MYFLKLYTSALLFQVGNRLSVPFIVFILALLVSSLCLAEVYKYKDEQGRWQYADKPPAGGQTTETIETEGKKKPVSSNLKDELYSNFQGRTPIEKAALAVVTIETPAGVGSGFFVSGDGYILTNKHVVRPSESIDVQSAQNTINELEEAYREAEEELNRREAVIGGKKHELDLYKTDIANEPDGSRKELMQARYEQLSNQLKLELEDFYEIEKSFKSKKRDFEKAKLEFDISINSTTIKTHFDIVIKGDKQLTAGLASVSNNYDLALLKVNGYETPYLEYTEAQSMSPGSTVYAIGSPLGIKDVITSGVIMKMESDYIMTDTTILPGNSGGPLVNEAGEVIGINTIKVTEVVTAAKESFGIAIPIDIAINEFRNILSN